MRDHSAWAGVLAAWAALPQPVIAAVQASAVGGGPRDRHDRRPDPDRADRQVRSPRGQARADPRRRRHQRLPAARRTTARARSMLLLAASSRRPRPRRRAWSTGSASPGAWSTRPGARPPHRRDAPRRGPGAEARHPARPRRRAGRGALDLPRGRRRRGLSEGLVAFVERHAPVFTHCRAHHPRSEENHDRPSRRRAAGRRHAYAVQPASAAPCGRCPSVDIAAFAMRAAMEQRRHPPRGRRRVHSGCIDPERGVLEGSIPARVAMLRAGIPEDRLSLTIDRACCLDDGRPRHLG